LGLREWEEEEKGLDLKPFEGKGRRLRK